MRALAKIVQVAKRDLAALSAASALYPDESIGCFERQRTKQHGIDETEDRRRDPNPQAERDDSRQREARLTAKAAERKPDLAEHAHLSCGG
jgi:hypothetical protein